jgi:hypothetical protein
MDVKDKLMSGTAEAPKIDAAKDVFQADPNLVALAQKFLDDVKGGKCTSAALILVNNLGNVQWPAHGLQACELYLAAGIFQRSIEGMVTSSLKNSRIIRPGG